MIYSNDGKLLKWVPNCIVGDYTLEVVTRVDLSPWLIQDKGWRRELWLGDCLYRD